MKFKPWLESTVAQATTLHHDTPNDVQAKNPTIAQAANIIKQFIDPKIQQRNPNNPNQALSGMYGTPGYISPEMANRARNPQFTHNPDSLEEMLNSLTYALPIQKNQLTQVAQAWRTFRDAVYLRVNEAWWGNNSPNPVLYDVAIQRVQSLQQPLQKLHTIFISSNEPEALLFNNFLKLYQSVIPNVVAQLQKFKQNTPRL